MQIEKFNSETFKVWRQISGESGGGPLSIELELYKKLLNFFQVGDYYYFIFNIANIGFDLVSPEIEKVLGYAPSEITIEFFMDRIHPDDRPYFLDFEIRTVEFLSGLPIDKLMKYKVRYDFRLKRKSGEYIRVLHQVAVVEHDDAGRLIRTLGTHTDITHLKPNGKPVMSYIGMDGEPSSLDIDLKNDFVESEQLLSRREKQVLTLLIEGKLSKEISEILHISKHTVDMHRKNMLKKTELTNTGELIGKAIKQGWV
jgi:DNA-binding CsgD family transcriptional regulator